MLNRQQWTIPFSEYFFWTLEIEKTTCKGHLLKTYFRHFPKTFFLFWEIDYEDISINFLKNCTNLIYDENIKILIGII